MEQAIFDNWSVLLRTVAVGLPAYVILVFLLRITGKRTLSKMNAFDFVITVALGSTLASILVNKNVSLIQGALALALLIFLQFVITWSSVRVSWVRKFVTGEPSLLLFRGKFLQEALRRVRVTEDEVRSAVRSAGMAVLDEADAVVLETDGSFTVIRGGGGSGPSSLEGVEMPERPDSRPE